MKSLKKCRITTALSSEKRSAGKPRCVSGNHTPHRGCSALSERSAERSTTRWTAILSACVCNKNAFLTAPVLPGWSVFVERRIIAVSRHKIAANHIQ